MQAAAYTATHAAAMAHPTVVAAAVASMAAEPVAKAEYALPTVEELTAHCTIRYVTLGEMFRSVYNVRPQADDMETDVQELLALIRAQGVLQNLIGFEEIIDGVKTGRIGIVAGDRRMTCVRILIESGEWPEDFKIPVMIIMESEAIAVSLAENSGRKKMHHADISHAMLNLHRIGASVQDIALCYGVEELVVRKRLKLANISPVLFKLYRADELSYEQMAAYALTDDHAKQEAAHTTLGNRAYPHDIRRMLTDDKVSVSDYMVKFVGLEEFEKAGGIVERDLFSDNDSGYISDLVLLNKLVLEKMKPEVKKLKKTGVAWIESRAVMTDADIAQYKNVRVVHREATAAEAEELAALENQMNACGDSMELLANNDEEESEEYQALDKQYQEMDARCDAIREGFSTPVPEDVALAGAVVYLKWGKVQVLRNVIRPDDHEKMITLADAGGTSSGAAKKIKPVHSDALTKNLTSHRTLALQAELMQRPDVAIVVATHAMVCREFSHALNLYSDQGLSGVRIERPMIDAEANSGKAAEAIDVQRAALLELMPKKTSAIELFDWLKEQEQPVIWKLFAYCTARSVDATLSSETTKSAAFVQMAKALDLNMTKWWTANDTSYFGRVNKDRMAKVVAEVVNVDAAKPIEKMKKGEAAKACTALLNETGWLPEMLRVA
jgi:ParB family chromosome partitioning protein